MTIDLLADEKVLYTKNYTNGISRTIGTVTVTDKRVISTVESKKCAERTEIKIDEVNGVTTKFSPASLVTFIVGVILVVFYEVFPYVFFNIAIYIPEFVYILYRVVMYIELACAVICIIIGLFRIRSGIYVILCTKNKELNIVSATTVTGRTKPIMLKPDKSLAKELAEDISATIKNAKAA